MLQLSPRVLLSGSIIEDDHADSAAVFIVRLQSSLHTEEHNLFLNTLANQQISEQNFTLSLSKINWDILSIIHFWN